MSCPCHIELTLGEKGDSNVKAEADEGSSRRLTKVRPPCPGALLL